jgi:sterol desaturase/sphingolipid hydroxylase (fatty acid hydroxylase superfamily)
MAAYCKSMLGCAILFAGGLGGWTLLEYVIHGPLSHRFKTFVNPLHDVHHRDPHAVFTARAWLPLISITLAMIGFCAFHPATFFFLGVVGGFVGYEAVHYRIHFARPRNRLETRLRVRHLAHHTYQPNAIFGVTSPFWDRVFGTEPAPIEQEEMRGAVRDIPALAGPSNWKRAFTMYLPRR